MEPTFEQYERVQLYLDGKMSSKEEASFLEEVSSDSTLQKFLQFEIGLRENLVALDELKVEAFASPASPSKVAAVSGRKINVINWKALIGIAACLVLAVAGLVWFLGGPTKGPELAGKSDIRSGLDETSSKEDRGRSQTQLPVPAINFVALFDDNYTREKKVSEKPDEIYVVLKDYEKENYNTLQDLDPSQLPLSRAGSMPDAEVHHLKEVAYFYRGMSFIETNDPEQALDNLSWVVNKGKTRALKQKAIWFQALVYVKQGNVDSAVSKLTVIAGSQSPYKAKATSLLKALQPQ